METLISSPAASEVRSVIKFLNAESIALIEIHRQLCQVYWLNIMSKQIVRRWCSSDLAPSDVHVFLHLKKFLSSGDRFGNDEELKTSVTRWFHSQAAEYYHRVMQKLIPRFSLSLDKYLNFGGAYVEK
ncbi:HTH_48 domain-containing protein [Trichonephila clavipes]|nr:HTH_48 domain-containing protein [Trichonephila clavipes]